MAALPVSLQDSVSRNAPSHCPCLEPEQELAGSHSEPEQRTRGADQSLGGAQMAPARSRDMQVSDR